MALTVKSDQIRRSSNGKPEQLGKCTQKYHLKRASLSFLAAIGLLLIHNVTCSMATSDKHLLKGDSNERDTVAFLKEEQISREGQDSKSIRSSPARVSWLEKATKEQAAGSNDEKKHQQISSTDLATKQRTKATSEATQYKSNQEISCDELYRIVSAKKKRRTSSFGTAFGRSFEESNGMSEDAAKPMPANNQFHKSEHGLLESANKYRETLVTAANLEVAKSCFSQHFNGTIIVHELLPGSSDPNTHGSKFNVKSKMLDGVSTSVGQPELAVEKIKSVNQQQHQHHHQQQSSFSRLVDQLQRLHFGAKMAIAMMVSLCLLVICATISDLNQPEPYQSVPRSCQDSSPGPQIEMSIGDCQGARLSQAGLQKACSILQFRSTFDKLMPNRFNIGRGQPIQQASSCYEPSSNHLSVATMSQQLGKTCQNSNSFPENYSDSEFRLLQDMSRSGSNANRIYLNNRQSLHSEAPRSAAWRSLFKEVYLTFSILRSAALIFSSSSTSESKVSQGNGKFSNLPAASNGLLTKSCSQPKLVSNHGTKAASLSSLKGGQSCDSDEPSSFSYDTSSLHGLRFLSMIWVIVMHSYSFALNWLSFTQESIPRNIYKTITGQFLFNGSFACDTFLLIAGFLLTYTTFSSTSSAKNEGQRQQAGDNSAKVSKNKLKHHFPQSVSIPQRSTSATNCSYWMSEIPGFAHKRRPLEQNHSNNFDNTQHTSRATELDNESGKRQQQQAGNSVKAIARSVVSGKNVEANRHKNHKQQHQVEEGLLIAGDQPVAHEQNMMEHLDGSHHLVEKREEARCRGRSLSRPDHDHHQHEAASLFMNEFEASFSSNQLDKSCDLGASCSVSRRSSTSSSGCSSQKSMTTNGFNEDHELQTSKSNSGAHTQSLPTPPTTTTSSNCANNKLDGVEINFKISRIFSNLLHRYIRMMPLMMAIIGLNSNLLRYFGEGENWESSTMMFDQWCRNNWWLNMISLHNFYDTNHMCLSHSWYSAVDLQLFLVGQFILLILCKSKKLGLSICGLLILAGQLFTGIQTYAHNLPTIPLLANFSMESMNFFYAEIYIKPYTRASPYLIGMGLAYLMRTNTWSKLNSSKPFENQQGSANQYSSFKLSKWTVFLGWFLALSTMTFIVIASQPAMNGAKPSEIQLALYGSLSRPLWALSIGWIIFASMTKNGGLLGKFLSARCFIPFSRLNYPVFLIHPVLIAVFYGSQQGSFHFSHYLMIYLILGNIVISYASAFLLSALFELPILSIERSVKRFLTHRRNNHKLIFSNHHHAT